MFQLLCLNVTHPTKNVLKISEDQELTVVVYKLAHELNGIQRVWCHRAMGPVGCGPVGTYHCKMARSFGKKNIGFEPLDFG